MPSLRAWTSARFTVPLPAGHRFPIAKYARIRDAVISRGLLPASAIHEPDRADLSALRLAHTQEYLDAVTEGTLAPMAVRGLGFPWSPALRERSLRTAQGTIEAARDALTSGAGINLAGGTHHAFADRGEGFCVFNDVALAIRVLQRDGQLTRAAVVDLDVHQGNGTARIFADDPDVFTFSMHGGRNYPFHKETSDLDLELEDGCEDAAYLALLERHLGPTLDLARPELVFYLAGADPYAGDRFGRLGLSIEGLRRRDAIAFDACRRRGLPAVLTMAGGYAHTLDDIVTIQTNSVAALLASHG
ncbi:MAG: histone deacetylase [Gemmatimonadales bacterium]|nr:histone deacetylase [Gemmatimonadales bacterium]